MRTIGDLLEELHTHARTGEAASLGALFQDMELSVLVDDAVAPADVARMGALLRDESYLRLADSWKLASFVDGNWERFGAADRTALRDGLVHAFDRHADWMGAFVTAEILGSRFADAAALQTLVGLSATARLPARALTTHGLEHLARTTADAAVKAAAIAQLQVLSRADEEAVRAGAEEALRRVDLPPPR